MKTRWIVWFRNPGTDVLCSHIHAFTATEAETQWRECFPEGVLIKTEPDRPGLFD